MKRHKIVAFNPLAGQRTAATSDLFDWLQNWEV